MSDVDALAELLTLIDQEDDGGSLQATATTGTDAASDHDSRELLHVEEAPDPDVFSGPVLDELLLVDDGLLSTGDGDAARDNAGNPGSGSDTDIIEALVLTQEEREELLSALAGEDDGEETRPGSDLVLLVPLTAPRDRLDPDMGGGNSGDRGLNSHSDEPSEAAAQPQQLQKVKKPRRRKRQKDEMNYLEYRVRNLEAQLERLQLQERKFTEETLAVAVKFNLLPGRNVLTSPGPDNNQWLSTMLNGPGSRSQLWQRVAYIEREETRTAVLENMRLRAQYESQLQVAKRLEALYHNQLSFAVRDFCALVLCAATRCTSASFPTVVVTHQLLSLCEMCRSWTRCPSAASSASALAWTRSATTQWCSPRSVATLTRSTRKQTPSSRPVGSRSARARCSD